MTLSSGYWLKRKGDGHGEEVGFSGKYGKIKGIRDAGSTADFRILFEILKFKNLKI